MKTSLLIYSSNLFQRLITNGLLPILPLYALDLGMSKSLSGIYLASSFLLLFISSIISGYLVDKVKKPKSMLTISSFLFVVLLLLHSVVNSPVQLFIATSMLWFVEGVQSVVITKQHGTRTTENNRGSKFAKFSISSVLGAVVGGVIIGVLLKTMQTKTMFLFLGLVAVFPFISSFFIKVMPNKVRDLTGFQDFNKKLLKNKRLLLFLISGMIISIVNYMLLLSVSFRMKEIGFSYSEISFSVVIGVLLSVPITYIFGKLSDKQGRKLYLLITYFCGVFALLLLFNAVSAVVFSIIILFKSIMTYARSTVSFAFISDLTRIQNLGKSVSYFGSSVWMGGIIGNLITGFLIEGIGFYNTLFIGLIIASSSIILLFSAFTNKPEKI